MKATIAALTCICAVMLPGAARSEQGQERTTYLEEIILTATKREESIRDVPIVVTAPDPPGALDSRVRAESVQVTGHLTDGFRVL